MRVWAAQQNRLESLDVLRGLAIFCMIFVDAVPDPDRAPSWMLHTPWQGISFADLAFPGFVFAMGAAMAVWLDRRSGRRQGAATGKIWRRTMALIILGLLYNSLPLLFQYLLFPETASLSLWEEFSQHGRWLGVLQRLALVYAAGMMLGGRLRSDFRILLAAFLLLAASSAGFHWYAPNHPFAMDHNISSAVDQVFPGTAHCYLGKTFDPEGLYGTIACTASVLFGMLAGRLLQEKSMGGVLSLAASSALLLAAGWSWSQLDMVSKPLWTAPYALYTSGVLMLLVALVQLLFLCVPRAASFVFHPMRVFGMNALFIYMATGVALSLLWLLPSSAEGQPFFSWLWSVSVGSMFSEADSIVCFALLWCVCWWPLMELLYRRRIFIKL